MPMTVCGSHKSGVGHNVLGRLLTLTYVYQELNVTFHALNTVQYNGRIAQAPTPADRLRLRNSMLMSVTQVEYSSATVFRYRNQAGTATSFVCYYL